MKRSKLIKVMFVVLAIVMLAAVPAEAMAVEDVWMAQLSPEDRYALQAQQPSLEAATKLNKTFETDENGDYIYPDEFGGIYIDSERDYKLIIKLVNATEAMKAKYLEICGNDNHIIVEDVEYSMNHLNAIFNYVLKLQELRCGMVEAGIDVIQNEVYIAVTTDYLTKSLNYNAFPSLAMLSIRIELGERGEPLAGNVNGGAKMVNTTRGSKMSIGICGTYNDNNVVLTCGHDNLTNDAMSLYNYSGTKVADGNVVFRFTNSDIMNITAKGDYGFVKLTGTPSIDYTMTKNILVSNDGTTKSIAGTATVTVGQTVYKYGAGAGIETGVNTYGGGTYKVLALDAYFNYSIYHGYGLVKMEIQAGNTYKGDSGGPAYVITNNSYYLAGIMTAMNIDATIAFYTPVKIATDAGFKVWTN